MIMIIIKAATANTMIGTAYILKTVFVKVLLQLPSLVTLDLL